MRIQSAPTLLLTLLSSLLTSLGNESSGLPYFQVTGQHQESTPRLLPLEATHAEVAIAGPLAQVTLTQTFSNGGSAPVDATYLFPASTGAAVHGMTVTIGDRVIAAEIEEKQTAQKIFQEAKKDSKTAALLEQHRPNLFQVSVARILPGDEIKVQLHYSELLKSDDNVYQYVLPTTFGPRYGHPSAVSKVTANPFLAEGEPSGTDFSLNLLLTSGLPLQSVDSPSHVIEVAFTSKQSARLSWEGSTTDPGNDRDVIVHYRLADEAIESGLLLHQGEDENFLQLTLQPPARVTPAHIPPRDYLFLIDVSGSMKGFPLTTTKELFGKLCGDLRQDDTFNMLLFAGSSRTLSDHPLPATRANITRALGFLAAERGGGGTELLGALKKGLQMPQTRDGSRSLVVISDGFINFEADAFQLVRENLHHTNLFAFGIGSSVNRHLIEGLAAVGDGEPFIVTKPSQAEATSERFQQYLSAPVLTNIEVTTDGCEVTDLEPSQLRDLFANRPLSLTAKWTGPPRGRLTVSGLTGGGETWTQSLDLAESAKENGLTHPALRPLWARERVRHLADYAKLSGKTEAIAEVTNLGLQYSLLTPWTSFVAVDSQVRKTDQPAQLAHQPNALPAGVGSSAVTSPHLYTTANTQPLVKNGSVPEPGPVALILLTLVVILFPRRRPAS